MALDKIPLYRTGIGQDSHRFLSIESSKPCVIGGLIFDEVAGFNANSDGDVVYHALCNAISSLSHTLIMGGIADELCTQDGITDSEIYLQRAVDSLAPQKLFHIAIALEAKKPRFQGRFHEMRHHLARLLQLQPEQVGLTATSGEGLTDFGCGDGVHCLAIVTTVEWVAYESS